MEGRLLVGRRLRRATDDLTEYWDRVSLAKGMLPRILITKFIKT